MKKLIAAFCALGAFITSNAEPPAGKNWKLVFDDDFKYERPKLDETWESERWANGHILCSRWPENVEVKDGILSLRNKKETRAGQDWTSGSIWTKKHFKYGYFECRYRYADAPGVNNSFWIMTRGKVPPEFKRFELDINEGHYPDELNCTIHNWSDVKTDDQGRKSHPVDHNTFEMGDGNSKAEALVSAPLDVPILVKKIRITSDHFNYFHIREISAFEHSADGYPTLSEKGLFVGAVNAKNLLKNAKVTVSGRFPVARGKEADDRFRPEYAVDGRLSSSWVSQVEGVKWIELELDEPEYAGCVQFVSGWFNDGKYVDTLPSYKLEYFDGKEWKKIKDRSARSNYEKNSVKLSKSWNTYALLWDENELVFYFNGKEMMRRKNEVAHYPAPVYLSAAITHWAHGVTDEVDGTSMDVDYVKIWQADEDKGGMFDPAEPPQKK